MSWLRRVRLNLLAVAALCGVSVCLAVSSGAVHGTEAGGVLQLSPVRQSLTVSPGKTGQVRVRVSNPTSRTITLQPVIDDFTTRDSSGTPSLFMGAAGPGSGRSFKQLVGELDEMPIPPGADKEITIAVTVPADAAPGGYYGAVRFVPTQADPAASNVSANAASLVLLSVPGDAKEDVSVESFRVESSGKSFGQFWLGENTAKVTVTFTNHGDIHVAPVGQIHIRHGGEVVSKVDFNQQNPRSFILPGSSRSWQFELDGLDQFGRYDVGAVFTYGSDNQTIEVSQSFWVVPLVYLVGGGAGVALVAMLVVSLLLRRSSRRHRI